MSAEIVTVDFETEKIEGRPAYPPKPVGVSVKIGSKPSKYLSFAHTTGNTHTKSQVVAVLKPLWQRSVLLFHGGKFDLDVAEVHMGLPLPPWERCHDTQYQLFLADPHAFSLELKPSAERWLGEPPEERDELQAWIVANIPAAHSKPSSWGEHIAHAPVSLVGRYARGDTDRTFKLHKFHYPKIVEAGMGAAYDRERKLMPILLRNEREGMRCDQSLLARDLEVYAGKGGATERVENWLRRRLKAPAINLDSDAQVAEALTKQGIVADWSYTKTGKKSTSKKTLTPDKFSDARVFLAMAYRNKLMTCLSTFMHPWAEMCGRTGGIIHTNWNQTRGADGGTRTGRPSTRSPNVLNIPKSFTDKGDGYSHPAFIKDLPELPFVRLYVLPDKGELFGHRDYNQQEFRLTAHFEDADLAGAYNANPRTDMHDFVRDQVQSILGVLYERRAIKTINFGLLYGMGMGELANRLLVAYAEAKKLRDAVRTALPGLEGLEAGLKECAKNNEPIVTWGGRLYYCEPAKWSKKFGRLMELDYKLLNYLVQGSAADVTKEAIIRWDAVRRDARFMVSVYDEINFSAPKRAMKYEMKMLRESMESVEIDVPMLTDGKFGVSWGKLEKFND